MSGKLSPYSVKIKYKEDTDAEFQKLEGCGHYITDSRLEDTWVLESLNEQKIIKDNFGKDVPSLKINATENTFSGFAGCNQMNGKLFFENGLLRFTQVSTTESLCEPNNKEAEFLKALQSSITYSIENNKLVLNNPSKNLIVFNKRSNP